MEYRYLGNTGLKVSRLCFGALTVGPLQANLGLKDGAGVIRQALEQGVNFIDTAKYYRTYPYIKEALKGYNGEVVITSRSYDYTAEDMRQSLKEALSETGRDYIDIFMLHEQESYYTLKGHWEALEYLVKAKEQGVIRAVGVSTHRVACVKAAAAIPEIDVIFPIVNIKGLGIGDGSLEDMLSAIRLARQFGKGIYGMKPLGGGNLISQREEALAFVLGLEELDAIALGMKSPAEVAMNIRIFNGEKVPETLHKEVASLKRRLHIEEWCEGCGKCTERCHNGALYIEGNRARVWPEKCLLCGYCSGVCPNFCIKVI